MVVLYHYTDDLAFQNVGNLEQTAAQLFASLAEERAHFGQGLYATRHEPADARLKFSVERNRFEIVGCCGFCFWFSVTHRAMIGLGLAPLNPIEQLLERKPLQSQTWSCKRLVPSVSVASQRLKRSEARPQTRLEKGMPSGAPAEGLAIERHSVFR